MNSTGKPRKMKNILLMFAVIVTALLLPSSLRAEDNISLDFRDTDIRQIIKVIAQQSGTNIIAEKSVRGQVTVKLTDVYYEEAMNLIAKTNGFAVRKIGNTWILADEKKLVGSQSIVWFCFFVCSTYARYPPCTCCDAGTSELE